MKKYFFKLIWCALSFLFLILFISCGGGGSADKEPNSTIAEANEVKTGEVFDISIDPKGDLDYFKVQIPDKGYLHVSVTNVPEDLVMEVRYSLFEEWAEKQEKVIRSWHRLPDAVYIPEAGEYYFLLHDDYDDKSSNQAMQVKADFIPEFDNYEPNNEIEQASGLELNGEIQVAVFPTGDRDWFKILIPERGYLKIMAKNVPDKIIPEVGYFVLDEWSDQKAQSLKSWQKLPDACAIPDSGEYYICLHDDYDDASSKQLIDLKTEFVPEYDVYEPNNTLEEAKKVELGDTLDVLIYPRGDVDLFYVDLEAGSEIQLLAKDYQDVIVPEVRLMIVNPEKPDELKTAYSWKKLPAKYSIEETNTYYIYLHDDYSDKCSEKVFQMMIK